MAENHTENCSTENQKSLTDTRQPTCHTPGMDNTKAMLLQTLGEMTPEKRARMNEFIRLVAERDEHALAILRKVEAGAMAAADALDALDICRGQ